MRELRPTGSIWNKFFAAHGWWARYATNVLKRPSWSRPHVKIHLVKTHLIKDQLLTRSTRDALDQAAVYRLAGDNSRVRKRLEEEDTRAKIEGYDRFHGKGPKFKIKK